MEFWILKYVDHCKVGDKLMRWMSQKMRMSIREKEAAETATTDEFKIELIRKEQIETDA